MRIEFFPMAQSLRAVRRELDKAFDRVVASGRLILGREVAAFEEEFAAYCGAAHCVSVGNGLDALAIGADVDPQSFNLDPARIEAALSPRTVAIMPVHLYGNPAAMDEINRVAARHGLFVLEDAAQAHGARYRSRTPPRSAFIRQRIWARWAMAGRSSPMIRASPSAPGNTAITGRQRNTSTTSPAPTRGSTNCRRRSCGCGCAASTTRTPGGARSPSGISSGCRASKA